MENQTESPKSQGDHILQVQTRQKNRTNLKLYGETLKVYPQVKVPGITFDSQLTFQNTLRTPWIAATPGTTN